MKSSGPASRRAAAAWGFTLLGLGFALPGSPAQDVSLMIGRVTTNAGFVRLELIGGPWTNVYTYAGLGNLTGGGPWQDFAVRQGPTGFLVWAQSAAAVTTRFFTTRESNGEDFDGDGLGNRGEFDHGADPEKPDTDGDGMNDGDEVNQGYAPAVSNEGARVTIRFPENGRRLP